MGIGPPGTSITTVQENLVESLKRNGIDTINKCLVYAPDAIGRYIQYRYPEYFTNLKQITKHSELLTSIYPPWTPVCFASMFSGTLPDIHGINRYEKPVLTVDTIFDAMSGNGKKSTIIAVQNSSIDLIFRERDIDYFSEIYDSEVIEKTVSVLKSNVHDFIVVYNQEYDDCLHRTTPYSPECLEALNHHNRNFIRLFEEVRQTWDGENWLLVYAPDHGAHFDPVKKAGTHGENIPEDMNLIHHYVFPGTL